MIDQKDMGIYPKYMVSRLDGRDQVGGNREGAEYFVLDLTYDPHAVAAVRAYAKSCRDEYPLLADDLEAKIEHWSYH